MALRGHRDGAEESLGQKGGAVKLEFRDERVLIQRRCTKIRNNLAAIAGERPLAYSLSIGVMSRSFRFTFQLP